MNELALNNLVTEIIKSCSYIRNFNFLFNEVLLNKKVMIGCNQGVNTTHENIFSLLFPDLEQQITFGTGKGGYKKYNFKKFTVDFYDRKNKIAIEIDGKSHDTTLAKLKDEIKEAFLYLEKGITTIRFTNQEVEEMLKKTLKDKLEASSNEELIKY